MINIDKLLTSKRLEVSFATVKVDKFFVKQFRVKNHLTQIALANILGVTKKTIEKWEQGANNINGSSAVLLKLLNDNPELLSQLYAVKIVEGKRETEQYKTIDSKIVCIPEKSKRMPAKFQLPLAAIF